MEGNMSNDLTDAVRDKKRRSQSIGQDLSDEDDEKDIVFQSKEEQENYEKEEFERFSSMSSSARIQKMIEDSIFRSNNRSSSYYKSANHQGSEQMQE